MPKHTFNPDLAMLDPEISSESKDDPMTVLSAEDRAAVREELEKVPYDEWQGEQKRHKYSLEMLLDRMN